MIKLINPFLESKKENYQCFGCSPLNNIGLKLEFWEDGEQILAFWHPRKELEGYANVLHGGIQATIHDEVASWTVYTKCKTAGVTSSVEVKYRKPVVIDGNEIVIKGELLEFNRRQAKIKTTIVDKEGVVCSEGLVTYFLFSQEDSKNKYQYPGVEKFYPTVQ